MRNTFTRFVFAAALTLLPAQTFAQPPGPERQLTALKEAVGLTAEQEKAIKPILEEQMKQQRALFEAGPGDDMREKMMALRSETNAKINKILKEDQIEKFEKFQASQRGRRPGGPPPPPQE